MIACVSTAASAGGPRGRPERRMQIALRGGEGRAGDIGLARTPERSGDSIRIVRSERGDRRYFEHHALKGLIADERPARRNSGIHVIHVWPNQLRDMTGGGGI